MKKVKKAKVNEWEWIGNKLTQIYIVLMLVVFPLFFTNKLFNLTNDKKYFFLFLTIAYMCILLPGMIDFKAIKWSWETIFFVALLVGILLSVCFAEDSNKAFFYMTSRSVNGMCFLCCVGMYFYIRKFGKLNKIIIGAWLAGSSMIYAFGSLCACKINLFYIQDGVSSPANRLTPLGNTNFNATYVCLMLSMVMVLFMLEKEVIHQRWYVLNLYMGFLFVFFIKTDSSMIAMAVGILVLGFFSVERKAWLEKYFELLGIVLAAEATVCLVRRFWGEDIYPFKGIGADILVEEVIAIELLLYIILYVLFKKMAGFQAASVKIRKYVIVFCLGATVCGIVMAVIVNCKWIIPDEDSVLNYLILKNRTFTKRGYIWKKTWVLIKEESIWQVLFGNGANHYGEMMVERFGAKPAEYLGGRVEDPHNEFLQIFMDMGIAGIVGYFGLILGTLVRAWNNFRKQDMYVAAILVLVVYLVQGLVNCCAITHLPLLLIFIGLVNGKNIDFLHLS